MIIPSPIPDCWIAQGIDTTADPIIVFQQLKMITVEDALASEPPVDKLRTVKVHTDLVEGICEKKEVLVDDVCWRVQEAIFRLWG